MPGAQRQSPTQTAELAYREQRRAYWEEYCREFPRWERARRGYRRRIEQICRFVVPPGMRVLELGCGPGDLLAALKPAYGVGVDFATGFVAMARERHPHLRFLEGDCHQLDLGETFDYIVLSDLVNDVWDVQRVLGCALRHSHRDTRILLNTYSRVWELPRRLTVPPIPALHAFAEGFCGGLTGGVVYCVVLACFQIDRLDLACLRALALSLVFGGGEMWRISRGRTLKRDGTCLLCTLAVSMLVLWGLGAALAGTERTRHEAPRPSDYSRLALIT